MLDIVIGTFADLSLIFLENQKEDTEEKMISTEY